MSLKLLKNARIVDGTATEPTEPMNIVIENGKFSDVGPNVTADTDDAIDLKA